MVFNRFYGHEAIWPQVFQLLYKQYTGSLLVVVTSKASCILDFSNSSGWLLC